MWLSRLPSRANPDWITYPPRARRWDTTTPGAAIDAVPAAAPNADLRYAYDAGGERTLKTAAGAAAGGKDAQTVYVFDSLELRRTTFDGSDYVREAQGSPSEVGYLSALGVRLANLHYALDSEPALASGQLHVLMELPDHLGSTSVVIDHDTSELVEARSYLGYGGADSDYRPTRWASFREDYGFTGKEDDAELGLTYFGARYLVSALGRWASADPAAVHGLAADANLYAYVHGALLRAVDPVGLDSLDGGISDGPDANSNGPKGADGFTAPDTETSDRQNAGNDKLLLPEITIRGVPDRVNPSNTTNLLRVGYGSSLGGLNSPGLNALALTGDPNGPLPDVPGANYSYEAGVALVKATQGDYGEAATHAAKAVVNAVAVAPILDIEQPVIQVGTGLADIAETASSGETALGDLAQSAETTAPGGGCFAAGTPIAVEGGFVPIESIRQGAKVWTRDPESGHVELRPVLRTFVHEDRQTLAVTLHSPAGTEVLHVTLGHPFWVENRGWVLAGALAEGDRLWSLVATAVSVARVEQLSKVEVVYNFEVQKDHSYFVGTLSAWVHNQSLGGNKVRDAIQAGDVTTYRNFLDRSIPGDDLEGHELWQHANLRANGLATERLSSAASQGNPVLSLGRDIHLRVNAAQAGLDTASMTPRANIMANANILRQLQAAPPETIDFLEHWSLAHAEALGF